MSTTEQVLDHLRECGNFHMWDFGRKAEIVERVASMRDDAPMDRLAALWGDEPDKVQWIDPATGYDCMVRRNDHGVWCGYVGLPPGHRFHGLGYHECSAEPRCEESYCDHQLDVLIVTHGGLTFSGSCADDESPDAICHVPAPGRPDSVWWLGFDCGHYMDLTPMLMLYDAGFPDPGTYRDLAYVTGVTADLANHLASLVGGRSRQ